MAKGMRANSEFFDLLAGDIFTRLYTHFPERISLHVDDGVIQHIDSEEDPERLKYLYAATARWLSDEDFIRFTEDLTDEVSGEGEFCDVVLTGKGLDALRTEDRGNKLRAAIKNAGSTASNKLISDIVGQVVSWAVRVFT